MTKNGEIFCYEKIEIFMYEKDGEIFCMKETEKFSCLTRRGGSVYNEGTLGEPMAEIVSLDDGVF